MARTQVTLGTETQRQARQRASELGISFAEYVRRVVARDLASPVGAKADVRRIFDLGDCGPTDISKDKEKMIGAAADALNRSGRRRARNMSRMSK